MAKELHIANQWILDGHRVAIAIVAKTWGSSPRRAGSIMIVRVDGTFEGSVSGGCVEGTVISEAVNMLSTEISTPKTLTFSVSSKDAWQVGLACGGEIEVRLFPINTGTTVFTEASTAIKARKHGLLKFSLSSNDVEFKITGKHGGKHSPYDDEGCFFVPIIPHLRLDIVGAVHIAQHLCVMAYECDMDVRVIDPRGAFTENRFFGQAELIAAWPDDFFKTSPPDASTAVVTLTHDPKLDDAALHKVLRSNAFYIGCLGSKKTHAARIARMRKEGHSPESIERINGPVGLDIGASTPAEIAASILSEIIQTARN